MKRKFRIALSGRLHRFDARTAAAEAVEYPGCYELVVLGADREPRVAFVGVAAESIRVSLEAHLSGALRPSLAELAAASGDGSVFFEFVSSSDIDSKDEHADIAGALIARHQPRFNEGVPPSTGKYAEVDVEEV
ncbi:MAG: hypothetical protein HY924_11430 [Elusimicrobia bacterium]|nr:hypothetical protein [Elusimicrobiota bacterium]